VARGKKPEEETPKESQKERKAKRHAANNSSIVRVVTDPSTGEEYQLQPYDAYPDVFRYMAKVMYISGVAGIPDIAKKLNIPENTIRTWQTRESWVALKREVGRIASRDAVRVAREAMSNYIRDIDRGLNLMLKELNERWENLDDNKKIDNEATIFKYLLDVWKTKLTIVRTLTYGVHGKAFTPHPTNLLFDGTEQEKPTPSLTSNSAEELLEQIPPYMKEAANFVLGIDVDDLDPAVLEAVALHIDAKQDIIDAEQEEDDDNVMF
jgi:hypothetical protein